MGRALRQDRLGDDHHRRALQEWEAREAVARAADG
jgi:hypothetical protein